MKRGIIGVDEAGRGPLAGPVAVGAAYVPAGFDWTLLPSVGDSKKLSEKKREEVFVATQVLKRKGLLNYAVVMCSASVIDKKGISYAIKSSLEKALLKLNIEPDKVTVLLDGGLKAPEMYKDQQTIIKGDGSELVIGLASIMAKVTRDRYMVQKSAQPIFAPYTLAIHKGYGTKIHREAIAKYGLSSLHRVSFCKNIKIKAISGQRTRKPLKPAK